MKKLILLLLTLFPLVVLAQGKNAGRGLNHEPSQILLISIILIILYLTMLLLKKYKILNLKLHKKILNIALLISFIITAYTSIAFILRTDFGINIGKTEGHIRCGIIMIWISIFHIIERWCFFSQMLKSGKKCDVDIK